jgi:DNA-binding transcriptional ArsR family regulator
MSIRVRVKDPAAASVRFVHSPLLESILSLSVLAQPSHHPLHHDWARRTWRGLPSEIKQGVADFGFLHMQYIPAGLIPPSGDPFPSFESELDRIRALPMEQQNEPILRNVLSMSHEELERLSQPAAKAAALDRAAELGSATVALVRMGIEDPERLVESFLGGIARYWEVGFKDEWAQVEPKLAAVAAEGQALVEREGIFGMLETLRPRVGVRRDRGEFWIRRAYEEELEIGPGTEILFVPSAYLWPHTGLVQELPGRLSILYAAPFAAFDSPPDVTDGMAPLLGALAEPVRLQALKLIAERPRSTQELAQLIAISEPAMSRHLRRLAETGVVRSERDGRYQLYSLDRGRIEPLSAMLLEFLESS